MMPRKSRQALLALCAGVPLVLGASSIHSDAVAKRPPNTKHTTTDAAAVHVKRPPNT